MAERSRRQVRKNVELETILIKERERSQARQVRKILKKPDEDRSEEERKILENVPDLVHHIESMVEKYKCLKERKKEVNDSPEDLDRKCQELAEAIKESAYTVVYTGAGISTSAQIPDYRGPNGIWTLLQKGKEITFKDLSLAEPTFTHMALKQLHKKGYISHIVSQNCDGLHLRSGIPKSSLSELHGNMFIEVCPKCKPLKQYVRLFDVTERTALRRHRTGRFCKKCKSELIDTIVHFGEKFKLLWPLNWKGAIKAADKAEVILCLGSSLQVMRKYQSLWALDRPPGKRPKLFIVNLQWTPKDSQATLKIHGKCDEVMERVMSCLDFDVPKYEKENDPIFQLATSLTTAELSSTTRHFLSKTCDVDAPLSLKTEADSSSSVTKNEVPSLLDISDQETLDSSHTAIKSETNIKSELGEQASEDCIAPELVEKAMNSHSGWYGKGLRIKKRPCLSNKRFKKESEDV